MKYHIGEYYCYPNNHKKLYRLIEVFNDVLFKFEDDHSLPHFCTDNVFEDMVRVRTGLQVFEDLQKEIEF